MHESGIPPSTVKGKKRIELEGEGGKTVLIYEGEKLTIVVPDSINFTGLDIIAKTKDIILEANNITIEANKIDIKADVTIRGNFTVVDGIVNLN